MGSIQKIVLTPLKWASKQVIHRTLLRFPGGDPHDPIVCTYCPEMCRFSCPTAVVSGNDAVTPCNKNGLLHKEERWPGRSAAGGPLWPIYDCTGCGRCTEYCVYEMPVADHLFAARQKYGWDRAREAAVRLTDTEDPVGDLAYELGDSPSAQRRLAEYLARGTSRERGAAGGGGALPVVEPHSAHYLLKRGHAVELSWQRMLEEAELSRVVAALNGRSWLLHESVWLSRRLDRSDRVAEWVKAARGAGARIEAPFQQGHDCIDCGGEGAYSRLFPDQARQMALEFWERDSARADGILCFSASCAGHFRAALEGAVPVVALAELARTDGGPA